MRGRVDFRSGDYRIVSAFDRFPRVHRVTLSLTDPL